jgi:hypothetical protein
VPGIIIWDVPGRAVIAIVDTSGDHCGSGSLADGNTVGLCLPVWNERHVACKRAGKASRLLGVHACQHIVGCLNDRCFRRSACRCMLREQVRRVCLLNGIDGVVHRSMHHGHGAGTHGRAAITLESGSWHSRSRRVVYHLGIQQDCIPP